MIDNVVKLKKPGHPLHDQLGRVLANRDRFAHEGKPEKRWMVDFTPNYATRATFLEDELVVVLDSPSY